MDTSLVLAATATLGILARVLGVLLYGTAAWSKFLHFDEFVSIVVRYTLAPWRLARLMAALVLAVEVATVLLLVVPATGRIGAALAIALLLFFAGAMVVALARGEKDLDCGCMSSALRQRVGAVLVLRNVVVALPFLPLLLLPQGAALSALAVLDGVAAGIVLFLLYLGFGALLAARDSFADLRRRYG